MVDPSPKPILLRARPDEAAAMSQLATDAQETWGFPKEQLDAWGELIQLDPGFFQDRTAWTLSRSSELLGWGAWSEWGRRCRLEHLWISPRVHRQGFGRILLQKLAHAAHARGWPAFEIVGEPTAEAFYRACGAQRTGRLMTHPGRTLDCWSLPFEGAMTAPRPEAASGAASGPLPVFTATSAM